MKEYYKILGLDINASMEDIIESYTRLAIKNNPSNGGTHYLFNIIHYAYNEIINNYNENKGNKEYLLLENFEIKSNINIDDTIIDADIEIDGSEELEDKIFIPEPSEICNEIYSSFKYFNTNPFIKDNNYDLKKIISKFNDIQLNKKNINIININSDELFIRKNIFKKEDILSKVGPAIDLALYICNLYNYDVNNNKARCKIKILLIRAAAKDIIAKNGGMVMNEDMI